MSSYMHPLCMLWIPVWANVQYVTLFLDETSLKKPEDIYEVIRERRHGNRYSAFLDRQASRDDASRDVFTHDLSTDSESSREMRALLEIWQKEPPLYAASVVEEKHGKKFRIVGTLFLYCVPCKTVENVRAGEGQEHVHLPWYMSEILKIES